MYGWSVRYRGIEQQMEAHHDELDDELSTIRPNDRTAMDEATRPSQQQLESIRSSSIEKHSSSSGGS